MARNLEGLDYGRKLRRSQLEEKAKLGKKKCTNCKIEYPLDVKFFYKTKSVDGFSPRCRLCLKDSGIKRYKKHSIESRVERVLKGRLSNCKTRAKKLGYDFNLTEDFLLSLWNKQKGLCAISGIKMTHITGKSKILTNVSVDRINSNLGYTIDNTQLVCSIINIMKNKMSLEDLIFYCKNIIIYNEKK